MPHSHSAHIETIKRIPSPEQPVPRAAAPTLALFAGGAGIWTISTVLALTDTWPWPISTVLNTVAAFVLFTVAHEASHNTISTHPAVNTWLGRISMLGFAPQAGFRAFRFIHMQHHRFTNHEHGRDPDDYTLPHHGLHHVPSEDRFKTTRNRVGAEPVLTPLLLYQNYHLVHHLHPVIPFYRYIAVWRRRESDYLSHGPALSSPRGRALTVEEYRALRAMD
jgi:fatty acid desaturase